MFVTTISFCRLTIELISKGRHVIFLDGWSWSPSMHLTKFVGSNDLPPLCSQKIYSKTIYFLVGIDTWNNLFLRFETVAPGKKSFDRFAREIYEKCRTRIEESGFRSHLFFDQHGGFRAMAKEWEKNRVFVIHKTPKKAPWCNPAEWIIGRIKN